jgi:hypothetical protein
LHCATWGCGRESPNEPILAVPRTGSPSCVGGLECIDRVVSPAARELRARNTERTQLSGLTSTDSIHLRISKRTHFWRSRDWPSVLPSGYRCVDSVFAPAARGENYETNPFEGSARTNSVARGAHQDDGVPPGRRIPSPRYRDHEDGYASLKTIVHSRENDHSLPHVGMGEPPASSRCLQVAGRKGDSGAQVCHSNAPALGSGS